MILLIALQRHQLAAADQLHLQMAAMSDQDQQLPCLTRAGIATSRAFHVTMFVRLT